MSSGRRCEIKCVVDAGSEHWLRTWLALHSAAFRRAFPDRQVNNIYFDSPDLGCFQQNLSGASERSKCRLRWYDGTLAAREGVLEIKQKRNQHGGKLQSPVALPAPLGELRFRELVESITRQLPEACRVIFQGMSQAVLLNRYRRSYYASFDGLVRVTVDRDLVFYDQRFRERPGMTFRANSAALVVLECKFAADDETGGRRLMSELPGRVTKCSKYVLGVESMLGY